MIKMNTVLGIALSLLVLTVFASAVLAGGPGKSGLEQGGLHESYMQVDGIVLSGPEGYILETGSHTFSLEGYNLEDFEGKKVSVSGTINDNVGGWDTLSVDSIEESMGFR